MSSRQIVALVAAFAMLAFPALAQACSTMHTPSYPGSTWTTANKTNDDTFQSLDDWNYGITDTSTSGSGGGYYPWGASGSAPYWGSGGRSSNHQDYDTPGNVSQTSTGADPSLFSGYTPQTWSPTGCGLTLTAHYTGPRSWVTTNEGTLQRNWTDGSINSFNKISFPTGGRTTAYVQIRAKMSGYAGIDNGSWDSLWFLGQGNDQREIDLQETGVQGGTSTHYVNSHLQTPTVSIESYDSPFDLTAAYHTYGMLLSGGVVTIYFDDQQIGTATSGTTGPYFLILRGGIFSSGLGWAVPPAYNVNMSYRIAEVQVYQR